MVDHQFADAGLAALYDCFCPWGDRGDFDFYLPLVMAAGSVLDVGCGTGALLHGARARGHGGRLCGLDPAEGMLRVARRRSDIEWIHGDLASLARHQRFDLVVMTGHAFQVLTDHDEMREALSTIRSVLGDQGRFVFETRHPLARAWEEWTPDHALEAEGPGGAVVRMAHQVEKPVHCDRVSFTTTFTCPDWDRPRVSRSTLRFLDPPALSSLLAGAGLAIDEQFGDWDGSPLTEHSPEIITITSRDTVES